MINQIRRGIPPILQHLIDHGELMGEDDPGTDPPEEGPASDPTGEAGPLCASADYGYITTAVARDGLIHRVGALASLPWMLRRARRKLEQSGYVVLGEFGVYPDIDQPVLAFHLGRSSASYVDTHLMPAPRDSRFPVLPRRILQEVLGYNPILSGVLTIGKLR